MRAIMTNARAIQHVIREIYITCDPNATMQEWLNVIKVLCLESEVQSVFFDLVRW
jgi:hypothetical protein